MAQITSYDGTPIVDAIVIGPDGQPGYSQTAQLGQPGFSNVIVDDPLGSMTFETWKDWTVDEDDCTFERLYTGIVYAIRVDRGPYRDGPGRKWYLDIVDQGQLLKQRVISGADGQRPFEMDTTRINWLYNSDYLDGLVFDNGFLNVTDNPQGQFDADHRFEYPMDVFVSVAGPISKHAFVYWDAVAEQPSIFYDRFDVSLGAAGIGFSNVMSDVDESTVFYPKVDAEATYDGEDRYGGLMLGWRGPSVYRVLASTVTDMGRVRDVTFQTDRIGLASTASSVTDLLLAQHADDLVSIKFSAELPSSAVRLAREGQTMSVRFEHIPGFETTQEVFIRSTIVQQIVAGRYLVQYDVAPNPTVPLVPTGGDPGGLPHEDVDCTPALVQVASMGHDDPSSSANWPTFAVAPTEGNLMVASVTIVGTPGDEVNPDGFTAIGAGWTDDPSGTKAIMQRLFYRIVQAGDDAIIGETEVGTVTEHASFVAEFDLQGATLGDFQLTTSDVDQTDPQDYPFDAASTTDGVPTVAVASLFPSLNTNDAWHPVEVSGASDIGASGEGPVFGAGDEPKSWVGYKAFDDTDGADVDFDVDGEDPSGNSRGYAGLIAVFSGTCSSGCPSPGQWVEDEVVTLTGADGTTACPFADGSLHVYIDNVEQTETLVSQDGETGDFTLGFTPTPTEVCTVRYQGR